MITGPHYWQNRLSLSAPPIIGNNAFFDNDNNSIAGHGIIVKIFFDLTQWVKMGMHILFLKRLENPG
jgi:hypothetical protein